MKHIKVTTISAGVLDAEVIKENPKTVIVRLPDGNIVKRHRAKHLVQEPAAHD